MSVNFNQLCHFVGKKVKEIHIINSKSFHLSRMHILISIWIARSRIIKINYELSLCYLRNVIFYL